MGKQKWTDKIKIWIGAFCFNVFLWSIDATKEEYWRAIYEQEKRTDHSFKC